MVAANPYVTQPALPQARQPALQPNAKQPAPGTPTVGPWRWPYGGGGTNSVSPTIIPPSASPHPASSAPGAGPAAATPNYSGAGSAYGGGGANPHQFGGPGTPGWVASGPTSSQGFNYGGVSAPNYQAWQTAYNQAHPSAGSQPLNLTPMGGGFGYHPPTTAYAANPVGSGGASGAPSMNYAQLPNPFTQAGNGQVGQAYAGAYGGGGYGGGYGQQYGQPGAQPYGGSVAAIGAMGQQFGQPIQAGGAGGGNGIAQVGSLIGPPQLPNTPAMLAHYPNYQADQTFSQIGGPEYLMRQFGPQADQGMLPSASTQGLASPALADRGASANLARSQSAYDLANQNANALLQWQGLGAQSDLGQFDTLAGLNNAQQNYLLGLYGNNTDFTNSLLGIQANNFGNVLGSMSGMTGGIMNNLTGGGLGGMLNGPNGLMGGLGGAGLPIDPNSLGDLSGLMGSGMGASGSMFDPSGVLSQVYGMGSNPLALAYG